MLEDYKVIDEFLEIPYLLNTFFYHLTLYFNTLIFKV